MSGETKTNVISSVHGYMTMILQSGLMLIRGGKKTEIENEMSNLFRKALQSNCVKNNTNLMVLMGHL